MLCEVCYFFCGRTDSYFEENVKDGTISGRNHLRQELVMKVESSSYEAYLEALEEWKQKMQETQATQQKEENSATFMQTKSSLPCFALISNIIRNTPCGFQMEMQMEYSLEKNVSISSDRMVASDSVSLPRLDNPTGACPTHRRQWADFLVSLMAPLHRQYKTARTELAGICY